MRICQDPTTLLSFYNMFENDMVQTSSVCVRVRVRVRVCNVDDQNLHTFFLPWGGEIRHSGIQNAATGRRTKKDHSKVFRTQSLGG